MSIEIKADHTGLRDVLYERVVGDPDFDALPVEGQAIVMRLLADSLQRFAELRLHDAMQHDDCAQCGTSWEGPPA